MATSPPTRLQPTPNKSGDSMGRLAFGDVQEAIQGGPDRAVVAPGAHFDQRQRCAITRGTRQRPKPPKP